MAKQKNKLPKHYKRQWLNDEQHQGTAYIVTTAEVYKNCHNDGHTLDASVEIKDCSRQMSLEFYCDGKKMYDKRLKKLDLIIDQLQELKGFMLANPPVKGKKKKNLKTVDEILAEAD